ncbi:MAG: hypothetical protein H0W27_02515 [Actinobacteria bacterium]|nr:hypothetical protein [Actinomycetota bacterium]
MRTAVERSPALQGFALPALLAISTVVATACSAGPEPPGPLSQGAGSSAFQTSPPGAGDRFTVLEDGARQLLEFDGPRVGGGRLRGFDYLGRDVVLWVFAPW